MTTYRSAAPRQIRTVVSLRGRSVFRLKHATIVCITTWNSLLRIRVNARFFTYYQRPYCITKDSRNEVQNETHFR